MLADQVERSGAVPIELPWGGGVVAESAFVYGRRAAGYRFLFAVPEQCSDGLTPRETTAVAALLKSVSYTFIGLFACSLAGCGEAKSAPRSATDRPPLRTTKVTSAVPADPTLALAGAPTCTLGEPSDAGIISGKMTSVTIAANRDGALMGWTDDAHRILRRIDGAGRMVGQPHLLPRMGIGIELTAQADGTFVLATTDGCNEGHECIDVLTLDRNGVALGTPARADVLDRRLLESRATDRGAVWLATPTGLQGDVTTSWAVIRAIANGTQRP
jgi:hypothetical protein